MVQQIVVRLDVMLARRKIKSKDLASQIGITEQNLSIPKQGHVNQIRFSTLAKICEVLDCQPGNILEFTYGRIATSTN
jgi:putative transcriptional regulator